MLTSHRPLTDKEWVIAGLKACALGSPGDEIAVHLLTEAFGGCYVAPRWPWMRPGHAECSWWIDAGELKDWVENRPGLSSERRSVLLVAAHLLGEAVETPSWDSGMSESMRALVVEAVTRIMCTPRRYGRNRRRLTPAALSTIREVQASRVADVNPRTPRLAPEAYAARVRMHRRWADGSEQLELPLDGAA